MTDTVLIVNPRSGGGRTGRVFEGMKVPIERALGQVSFKMTERSGHAVDLAKASVEEGANLVIAVGGDGTFNEVVNGVLRANVSTRPKVGMIAQGTGGDFRRTLGLEHRLDKYLAALTAGRTRTTDVGKFSYRTAKGETREHYFVNILSAGLGGLVDRYVAEAPTWLGGTAAYLGASVRALVASSSGRLRCSISLKGETSERSLTSYMIAICNGQYFGSGMHVAPMAVIDDGVFEVVSIGGPSKVGFAMNSRKIYSGSHLGTPFVEHFRCDRIRLDLENDEARSVFLIDVDGEPLGGLPLDIEVVPSALTLVA